MSQQDLKRVEVIALRRSGRIDQAEAALRLGVPVRQVRRLEARVARRGAAGLRSARRGQPSNHRLALASWNESNEGKKRYAVATLPIRQRVATRSGDDDRSGEHRNANALRLEHHETACEPIRVLAYQIEHPGPDG